MKAIIILLFVSLHAYAEEQISFKNKESLQKEIVRAINSNDKLAYINTYHPLFRNKLSNKNNEFFNLIFDRQLSYTIPENYDAKFSPIKKEDISYFISGDMPYPATPSTILTIQYNKTKFSSISIANHLTHDKYGWHQILGIPNDKYLEKYRVSRERKRIFKNKLNNHIANMDKALYQEIVNILKNENNLIKAHKIHMKKTGTNQNLSIQAVKLIKKSEGIEW